MRKQMRKQMRPKREKACIFARHAQDCPGLQNRSGQLTIAWEGSIPSRSRSCSPVFAAVHFAEFAGIRRNSSSLSRPVAMPAKNNRMFITIHGCLPQPCLARKRRANRRPEMRKHHPSGRSRRRAALCLSSSRSRA